jgi:ABC-type glutathione transport system ATPase component
MLRGTLPGHRAVDAVSFTLGRGEILGVAGGSGSGKTTLARCLIRLVEPDEGSIRLDGEDVRAARGSRLRELRRRMQMVFQDPYASLNPRITVGSALHEAGRVHRRPGSEDREAFVGELLERVHLPASIAVRRPRELSGGQRQRVAVARALAVGPEILIADEAVSVAIVFIAHQLAVIAEVADRVAIMHQGRIVETGPTASVFHSPQDPYTVALLGAHPGTHP